MTTLIFDLDGTLIDTTAILLPAFAAAIRCFPMYEQPSEETCLKTFGMSDDDVWRTLLPEATSEQRQEALNLTETYVARGLNDYDALIDGAFDTIQSLHARGYTLTIASNCGEAYLNNVLDSQGLRPFFTRPLCLASVHGVKKADILTEHFRHFRHDSAWMIGDRKSDVEAAKAHGIPCVGCSYGFSSSDELQDADPIIHHPRELLTLFPA